MSTTTKTQRYLQFALIDADKATAKTVIERQYLDGRVEYWGIFNMTLSKDGVPMAQAAYPFLVMAGKRADSMDVDELMKQRNTALETLDKAGEAFKPIAQKMLEGEIAEHQRKEGAKIILAKSLPNIPVAPLQ